MLIISLVGGFENMGFVRCCLKNSGNPYLPTTFRFAQWIIPYEDYVLGIDLSFSETDNVLFGNVHREVFLTYYHVENSELQSFDETYDNLLDEL